MAEKALLLPKIDLSSPDRASSVRTIRQVCLDHVFFYLINHGVDGEFIKSVFDGSRKFFSLPLQEKMKLTRNEGHKGYTALYDETLDTSIKSKGWTGLFCPCVLFGRNVESLREDIPWTKPCICHAVCVEGGIALAALTAIFHGVDPRTSFLIGEGLLFAWWMCGIYTGLFRQSLQKKYHLKNSPCDPCVVHCCMHWCALCQEHREMKGRLSDNVVMPMTIINPPPLQEMSSENRESTASENGGTQQTSVEIQAL